MIPWVWTAALVPVIVLWSIALVRRHRALTAMCAEVDAMRDAYRTSGDLDAFRAWGKSIVTFGAEVDRPTLTWLWRGRSQ